MRIGRIAGPLAATFLCGCSGMQYHDNFRAVDATAECATQSPQPGEPVAPWCERTQSMSWSTDSAGEPVDFTDDDH